MMILNEEATRPVQPKNDSGSFFMNAAVIHKRDVAADAHFLAHLCPIERKKEKCYASLTNQHQFSSQAEAIAHPIGGAYSDVHEMATPPASPASPVSPQYT